MFLFNDCCFDRKKQSNTFPKKEIKSPSNPPHCRYIYPDATLNTIQSDTNRKKNNNIELNVIDKKNY